MRGGAGAERQHGAGESEGESLLSRIAASPVEQLGRDVAARFDARLPFLLKVLAAETPLSLQAHPSAAQAREGFEREEAAGVPRSAGERNYRDRGHKPEILCALGTFEALCGFRPADDSVRLLRSLRAPALAPVLDALEGDPGPGGLRAATSFLLTVGEAQRANLLAEVVSGSREALAAGSEFETELAWALEIAARYPGDAGVVVALLLNYVRLERGEAVFLPAGNLHSYLRGTGVELMASSDNVIRGGLTPKHVDVGELMRVLDFRPGPVSSVAVRRSCEHEVEYGAPVEDFRLSLVTLEGRAVCRPRRRGPEILLCLEGGATVEGDSGQVVELARGRAVFVPASDGSFVLRGPAVLCRATVGEVGNGDAAERV